MMMIRDINSLLEHIKFSFDRLDYLQDTFRVMLISSRTTLSRSYHRVGDFYAAYAYCQHLRDEFRRNAGIEYKMGISHIHWVDGTFVAGHFAVF